MKDTDKTKRAGRLLCICLALCLAAALCLCACTASVPEGMDEEQVKQAAEQTIRLLDEQDYTALMHTMDETMRDAITEQQWADTWQPYADSLGALVEVESHSLVEQDGYAVDVAKAAYENGTLTFTLSYDTEYRLAGLYMK